MWFQKKREAPPPSPPVIAHGEFSVGQVVAHKIDGVRMVIIGFGHDEYGPLAVIAFSSKPGDETECHLAELTAVLEAQPVSDLSTTVAARRSLDQTPAADRRNES